jgi:dihydroorotase
LFFQAFVLKLAKLFFFIKKERMNKITIPRWFDRHLHVREGEMLTTVLPYTINQRAIGAVIMGNLVHPNETSTLENAITYRRQIKKAIPAGSDFKPCMTCYLTDAITPEDIIFGYKEGVWDAVKLYIADSSGKGGTTNSGHGVRDVLGRYPVFEAMEKYGIPLLGHFEAPELIVDEFDREIVSAEKHLLPIMKSFPKLQIVFEHLTDGRTADIVAEADHPIYATVTPHHLMINRNALFAGGLNPINWCKPVAKREKHRLRVRTFVTGGNKRFGAGTDSAPHGESKKAVCCGCAAGIFTAPMAVELYATIFEEDDAVPNLGPFLSENFLHVYRMKVSTEMMTIERTPLQIPEKVGGVRVFNGGTELPWTLVS